LDDVLDHQELHPINDINDINDRAIFLIVRDILQVFKVGFILHMHPSTIIYMCVPFTSSSEHNADHRRFVLLN
jgi:hypothetical protein